MRSHTKWIAFVALVLMVLAMFAYVVSDDEAFPPTAPDVEQGVD